MKHLLIYINPKKEFDTETEVTARIQIENILELGYPKEDILLITNFPYEFMGVKSTIAPDSYCYTSSPTNTKFWAIANMFIDNMIGDDLYWAHDFDCFQLEYISDQEILDEMNGGDIGICDYGATEKYSCGSVFFNKAAADIFIINRSVMELYKTGEEKSLTSLVYNNLIWIIGGVANPQYKTIPGPFSCFSYIKNRIKRINFTYNFWNNNLKRRCKETKFPLRTVHFDPFYKLANGKTKFDYMSGENNLGVDFVGERLTKIFNKYGITRSMEAINDLNAVQIYHQRRVWKHWLKKYNIKSICEVGVSESQNFRRLLAGEPDIIVGVDIWSNDGIPGHNDAAYRQKVLNKQCDFFKSLMLQNPNIRLYRQLSYEAAENFPDEYFDLIYIDGDHSYEGVKKDLEAWWPKVKPGKFFTGDDYSEQHAKIDGVDMEFEVIRAVDEFAEKVNRPVYKLTQNGWAIIK